MELESGAQCAGYRMYSLDSLSPGNTRKGYQLRRIVFMICWLSVSASGTPQSMLFSMLRNFRLGNVFGSREDGAAQVDRSLEADEDELRYTLEDGTVVYRGWAKSYSDAVAKGTFASGPSSAPRISSRTAAVLCREVGGGHLVITKDNVEEWEEYLSALLRYSLRMSHADRNFFKSISYAGNKAAVRWDEGLQWQTEFLYWVDSFVTRVCNVVDGLEKEVEKLNAMYEREYAELPQGKKNSLSAEIDRLSQTTSRRATAELLNRSLQEALERNKKMENFKTVANTFRFNRERRSYDLALVFRGMRYSGKECDVTNYSCVDLDNYTDGALRHRHYGIFNVNTDNEMHLARKFIAVCCRMLIDEGFNDSSNSRLGRCKLNDLANRVHTVRNCGIAALYHLILLRKYSLHGVRSGDMNV